MGFNNGFVINANGDLSPFNEITPCGIKDEVTNIEKETDKVNLQSSQIMLSNTFQRTNSIKFNN